MRDVFKRFVGDLENRNDETDNKAVTVFDIDCPVESTSEEETSTVVNIPGQIAFDGFETETELAHEVVGVVTDCLKLNVREQPKSNANVVAVINALSEVVIDYEHSTDLFYKICNSAGIEGYCMKRYIAIRSQ